MQKCEFGLAPASLKPFQFTNVLAQTEFQLEKKGSVFSTHVSMLFSSIPVVHDTNTIQSSCPKKLVTSEVF